MIKDVAHGVSAPLLRNGWLELVESPDDGLAVLYRGNKVCDLACECAAKLRWLFAQLRSPAFAEKFDEKVNCHGLAEYMLCRSLKWRNKPKRLGDEVIAPNAPLPADLPHGYQLINWDGKAVHSGVLLGRKNEEQAFVLEKCNGAALHIHTYRSSVQSWSDRICALSSVRLRRYGDTLGQSARKAG